MRTFYLSCVSPNLTVKQMEIINESYRAGFSAGVADRNELVKKLEQTKEQVILLQSILQKMLDAGWEGPAEILEEARRALG